MHPHRAAARAGVNNDYRFIAEKVKAWRGPFTKTVSIVLPVFNARELLERTLAALKRQTYPADLIEVIVADDGSSDGLDDLLRAHRSKWRLEVVRQEHLGFRAGLIRGKAIRAAAGEVIVALDADMAPPPEFLDAHMRWFHCSSQVATIGLRRFVCMHGVSAAEIEAHPELLKALPEIASASDVYPLERRLRELRNYHLHPAPWNVFHGCNVAYRRDDAIAVGLYDSEFDGRYGYEDIEFGFRLHQHGVYLVHEPRALALHQESTGTTREARRAQSADNYPVACRKMPGYAEFRERFARNNYVPWW